mgnify:CR=1 FL=1
MEGLMPTFDVNGGNNNDGWGNWGGALIGGAIGGAVGSAWNGNRWNNGGPAGAAAFGETFLMASLSSLRSDVGSISRDQLVQTQQLGQGICQGFGGIATEIANLGAQLSQGQCRTEAAVLTTGLNGQIQQKDNTIATLNASHAAEVQNMRNTFELKSSIDSCCCTTNANISSQGCQTREVLLAEGCATRATIKDEGEKTRALIAQLDRERLLRESAAKDAKIAQLEAQSFNTGLAASTQAQCRQDMNQMMANIIGHVAILAGNRSSTTTPSTAQAA